ncbi:MULTISPECIES: sterol desaturase family protein [unclassified Aureispira]|uniref:sterol desaturase family protein n=1 Tax=unclassified Aureispira TaxID=2649989 RepID=UPI0006977B51|nr:MULTISPECIES: sterol desaturase family protein [unclassified Aureispira]WMX14202.1 sterol desaturase family protein [Aureispira sp. CCB-E]
MSFDQLTYLFDTAGIMRYVAYFFMFNLGLVAFEIALDLWTSRQRRWGDSIANISIFFLGLLTERIGLGIFGILFLVPISWITPFHIPLNTGTWVIAFFVADFTYYWMHRMEHEHRILWAVHSVHHSSEDYNLTVSMRLSIIESLFEWIFLIPMILIGFTPFQAIVSLILVAQFQTWIHTERIRKLGWLDEIFNTPSVHRVHHGSNTQYLDKNYGGVLIVWDKLFGTFQREDEKVVYGLTKNIHSNNPIVINFVEFKHIWNDVKKCHSWKDRLKIIFGGLTWRPDYFEDNSSSTPSSKQTTSK